MPKVRFGDVVREVKHNIDRNNNPYESYVAGDHMDTADLTIHRRGCFATDDVGPAFVREFKKGQVLYGSRRTYLKKVAVADFDGVTANTTFVLETKNPDIFLQTLLPFVMLTDSFTEWSVKRSKGSTNPYVLFSDLADFEFELPDIEEQRRVSDVLWACFRLREHYEGLIQQCDALVQSQFVEMFGELGTDNHGWGLTTLGKCCVLNPTRPRGISPDLQVSFVAMPSVTEKGEIDSSIVKPYSEASKGFTYFEERDVLFAKITPCMENGKGCVATGLTNGIGGGSTEFHVLRPISGVSNPYWLYCISIMPKFRKNARKVMTGTGGQLRVPISFIDSQPITLPPIDLQDQFEEFYHETDKSKLAIRQALESLEKSRSAIMTKVFG